MTTATDVAQLSRTEIKEAAHVLARAFHDDPIWGWVQPDESRRARLLSWFMETWVAYCHNHGDVQTTAGRVEGVAMWVPPGRFPLSTTGMLLSGMILMPLKFGLAPLGRFMSLVNHLERLHKRDVPKRHWYLSTLGVDPPRQGQGVGGTLLQPVLARADAEGLPCYLETEKEINVRFYNRHGFDVVLELDPPRDGPHVWTMMREPVR